MGPHVSLHDKLYAFHMTIVQGELSVVQELLRNSIEREREYLLQQSNEAGFTALHLALFECNKATNRLLDLHEAIAYTILDYATDVNIRATSPYSTITPLYSAIALLHQRFVRMILDKGAMVSITALVFFDSASAQSQSPSLSPLFFALYIFFQLQQGTYSYLKKFTIGDFMADISEANILKSSITEQCKKDQEAIITLLIAHGADKHEQVAYKDTIMTLQQVAILEKLPDSIMQLFA